MKVSSLFRRSDSTDAVAKARAQDHAEKLLVESFRMLSAVCSKMADYVEAQRLSRQGFETPGTFLERLERSEPASKMK